MKHDEDRMKEIAYKYRQAHNEGLLRQMVEVMEHLYDWLDSGKSFEEVEIMIDISAAGGQARNGLAEWCHRALDIIRSAREENADRTEVMTFMRKIVNFAKSPGEIADDRNS
jgi:hypothetical protein